MRFQFPARSPLDTRTEYRCGDIEVVATRWDPERHAPRRSDSLRYDALEFMRTGSFCRRLCGRWTTTDCTTASVFRADEEFETDHPIATQNLGTTIRFHRGSLPRFAREAIDMDPVAFGAFTRRSLPPTTPRCHALHRVMLQYCRTGTMDSLLFHDLLRELFVSLFASAGLPNAPTSRLLPRSTDHGRLQEIRALVLGTVPGAVRLMDIAEHVGVSDAHLSRWFHAHAGIPLHRYVLRVRLRHSLERLAAGEDLSRLALASGFSSHSHFSAAFQREFGVTPSAFRQTMSLRAIKSFRTQIAHRL